MSEISIHAQPIFWLSSFPVTNTLALSVAIFIILFLGSIIFRGKLKLIPASFQNLAEIIIEGAFGIMDPILGSRRTSERYLPLTLTIFLFVLFSNWLGLLPGVGSIIVKTAQGTVPLFRSPASDLNFTIALALIAVTMVNVFGVGVRGLWGRISVFINFRSPMGFFVGLLELISEFAKIISFSFRLFGNVFAGEVLLAIMAYLLPYLAPVPFMVLEIFFGFIQAFIFAILTLIFISIAVSHEEGLEES